MTIPHHQSVLVARKTCSCLGDAQKQFSLRSITRTGVWNIIPCQASEGSRYVDGQKFNHVYIFSTVIIGNQNYFKMNTLQSLFFIIEAYTDLSSILAYKKSMAGSEINCGCTPSDCKSSDNPYECPNCNWKECQCWAKNTGLE